jgi:prepilin-type processing-associated H-X9-DG protein
VRNLSCMLLAALFMAAAPAVAQEQAPGPATPDLPQEVKQRAELFKQMGMPEEQALVFSLLTSGETDPAQMLLLMMMMDQQGGGGAGGEGLGVLMLMNALGGQKGGKQPVVLDRGESLLIIEDGVLYNINLQNMELVGSVRYGRGAGGGGGALTTAILLPVLARAREKALQASCLSNVKQLCLGMLMYATDYDEVLAARGPNWVEDIEPYIKNTAILRCPSRPELPVGYAMSRKLIGAKLGDIQWPGETILFFESNLGGPNPVGGPDDVPAEGVHNGGINCGFVDGHAKWLRADTARQMLEQDPF